MPPSEQIEKEIKGILSSPEFQSSRDYLGELIKAWIKKFFKNIGIDDMMPDFVAFIIFMITIIILIYTIVFILSRVFRVLGVYSLSTGRNTKEYKGTFTSKDALSKADAEAKSQNYTLAIRWVFIYILLVLDEQKFIKIHESKTNTQYINELKNNRHPNLALFQDLVLKFNLICYGGKDGNMEDYLYWMDAASTLTSRGSSNV